MSRNTPISVNTRSKHLTRYLVSIESPRRSGVPFGGMGGKPHCEQLLFWYFRHSEHPPGARGRTLRYKNTKGHLRYKKKTF